MEKIRYRFKTEDEFIEDYGNKWRDEIYWTSEMDDFFGAYLDNYIHDLDLNMVVANNFEEYYLQDEMLFKIYETTEE